MAERGRPRGFDRAEALKRAMHVFWSQGYEGATLAELKAAMGGITAPSLYAAFRSKEDLFREAVELYRRTDGTTTARALTEQPTARAAVETMLRDAVKAFTTPGKPSGCLIVLGAMNSAIDSRNVQEHLQAFRRQTPQLIRRRLERGVAEGDVPPDRDLAALASFYATLLHGLSIQARDGATRSDMMAAIECGMAAWDGMVGPSRKTKRPGKPARP